MDDKIFLRQLNQLEQGLNKRILDLLDHPPLDLFSFLKETSEIMEKIWHNNNLEGMNIEIDDGEAAGLTLQDALRYRYKKYSSELEFSETLQYLRNGYDGGVPFEQTYQLIDHVRQSSIDQSKGKFQP